MKLQNQKKSQAAMEFLMTYGWAILVVLAAIAALAYFGVLSPEKFLPEKCVLSPGIACVSHRIDSGKVTLILSNGLGRSILVNSVEVGKCIGTFIDPDDSEIDGTENGYMISGNQTEFTMPTTADPACANGNSKEAFKGDVTLKYTERDTGLQKTVYGSIATKIE